jgi:hypothetical protein
MMQRVWLQGALYSDQLRRASEGFWTVMSVDVHKGESPNDAVVLITLDIRETETHCSEFFVAALLRDSSLGSGFP